MMRILSPCLCLFLALSISAIADDFRVAPYLQYVASDAATITWFSNANSSGTLTIHCGATSQTHVSLAPVQPAALNYKATEIALLPGGVDPGAPWMHRIRATGLAADSPCSYTVTQGGSMYAGAFRTAPDEPRPIRFMAFADSETEPESTGKFASWPDPADRVYLVDQTDGFRENLKVMASRSPDFIAIAGDLVETGGEQRDWDEFWRQMTAYQDFAGCIPIMPAPGNHEYFGGGSLGTGYGQPASETGFAKFLTYFDVPGNGAPNPAHHGRYYRHDFPPVALLAIDTCNGEPHLSQQDTSWYLLGEGDGGVAPNFNPGSRQYQWLEGELASAQADPNIHFTFVMFHQCPYSVGPHGVPPSYDGDRQSGVPARVLTPLFLQFGVDAVLCGHDEMYERSLVTGVEKRPDGSTRPHGVHFYDIGIGGDGLRKPAVSKINNLWQQFIAHDDSPEVWQNGTLVDGGKHYGHLEVDVRQEPGGGDWVAELRPVYVFPLNERVGNSLVVSGFERRIYDDVITLRATAGGEPLPTTTPTPTPTFSPTSSPTPTPEPTPTATPTPEPTPSPTPTPEPDPVYWRVW